MSAGASSYLIHSWSVTPYLRGAPAPDVGWRCDSRCLTGWSSQRAQLPHPRVQAVCSSPPLWARWARFCARGLSLLSARGGGSLCSAAVGRASVWSALESHMSRPAANRQVHEEIHEECSAESAQCAKCMTIPGTHASHQYTASVPLTTRSLPSHCCLGPGAWMHA